MKPVAGYHIPGFSGDVVSRQVRGSTILLPRLTADEIARATDLIMENGSKVLPAYSTDDLAAIFGRVAAYWQRPSEERESVVVAIADLTGLSRPVVERSITVEQGNSSTADILAAMDRDLGDHRCLDHFVDDSRLRGRTRAFGPPLVAAVLTANVPGLSYLPMVRALMVKSPLAAKLSSGEPVFGPAWLKSLARLAPDLADCVALFCWQGGNPEFEKPMFRKAPVVIVYGGPQSVPRIRAQVGPHKKIIEHGHKIGLAMVGKEMLGDRDTARKLAAKLALDMAMFDQRACIAPQLVYAEKGGTVSTIDFAGMVSVALADLEKELPAGPVSLDTAATLAQERNTAAFSAAQQPGGAYFAAGTATVVHEEQPGFAGALPTRFLRVFPVADLVEAISLLAPHGPYLQNVGIAVSEERLGELAEQLGRAGASHITSIGLMHRPTMRWRHDGLATFAEMVRWTDIEMSRDDG